jgi:DNA-binding transcriptional ArsR family regulator
MSAVATEVDELLSAVADPTRRRVLDGLLDRGAATATVLAGDLPVTRQAVAKHLAVLDRAGLVEGTRHGREVRYVVRPQRLVAATRSMAQIAAEWDARLLAIKRIAESLAREQQVNIDERSTGDDGRQGRDARGVAGRPQGAAGS